MRIHCDVCESNVATIMCCADEAALCSDCDAQIHAANKVANKHQRVQLLPPSGIQPKCDICQDKCAFFFCIEERALFCRTCDVSVHNCNPLSAKHRRLLVTGTRVGLVAASDDFPEQVVSEADAGVNDLTPATRGSNLPSKGQTRKGIHTKSVQNATSTVESYFDNNPYGTELAEDLSLYNSWQSNNTTNSSVQPSNTVPVPSKPVAFAPSYYYEDPVAGSSDVQYDQSVDAGQSAANGRNDAFTTEFSPTIQNMGGMANIEAESLNAVADFADLGSDLEWDLNDFLNIPDLASGYSFADIESSKAAHAPSFGEFDWVADASLLAEHSYAATMVQNVPHSRASGSNSGPSDQFAEAPNPNRSVPKLGRSRAETSNAVVPKGKEALLVPDVAEISKKRQKK